LKLKVTQQSQTQLKIRSYEQEANSGMEAAVTNNNEVFAKQKLLVKN